MEVPCDLIQRDPLLVMSLNIKKDFFDLIYLFRGNSWGTFRLPDEKILLIQLHNKRKKSELCFKLVVCAALVIVRQDLFQICPKERSIGMCRRYFFRKFDIV